MNSVPKPVPSYALQIDKLNTRAFLLILAVALLAAFPRVLIGSHTFFYRDFGAYCYPLTLYTRDTLLSGELPLWNPYSQCGSPLLAQLGQLYPPFLLGSFLPMPWAANFLALAHLLWAGLGMYWLARRWGAGTFAASFAGMAYVFNGLTLSSMVWTSYIAALSWLPWIVGCAQEAWRQGGRWVVLTALASAFQVLSGMPELTLLTWLFLGTLWIFALAMGEVKFRPAAMRMASIVLLTAGVTMIQVLPFLDLMAHSQRNQNSATGVWSMPGWGWANLLVPLFHAYRSPQGLWFLPGQDVFPSYYPGAGVLALAVVGAWRTRRRLGLVVAGLVLLCWTMALGSNGHLYDWIRHVFPAIGFARFPVKFVLLPSFLLPLLAAWGLEHIQNHPAQETRRGLGILLGLMLLLMGALVFFAGRYPFPDDQWRATAWNTFWRAVLLLALFAGVFSLASIKTRPALLTAQLLLLALLPLDALTHSPNIVPTLPSSALAPGLWAASGKPPPKIGEGRVMISPLAEQRLLYSYVPSLETDLLGKRLAEWYNLNLLDKVPKVNGAVQLHPAAFDRVEQYLYYTTGARFGPGLLDFLSVAWVTSPDNAVEWVPRTNYLPVLTAGQSPVFSSDDLTLAGIMADDFDPRSRVYLPESARAFVTVSNRTTWILRNARFSAQSVEAETETAEPSLVVLSQTFYHLWQAYVDEKPTPLLRANLAFQALQVPSGKHHIKLIYRDPNLIAGAILSTISIALCALLWSRSNALLKGS